MSSIKQEFNTWYILFSKYGSVVDPEKVKAIMNWPIPKYVSAVFSFMGIAGHYRIFMEGFSKLVYPITSLKTKGVNIEWMTKWEGSFHKFKKKMTTTPILKISDPNKEFIVCT